MDGDDEDNGPPPAGEPFIGPIDYPRDRRGRPLYRYMPARTSVGISAHVVPFQAGGRGAGFRPYLDPPMRPFSPEWNHTWEHGGGVHAPDVSMNYIDAGSSYAQPGFNPFDMRGNIKVMVTPQGTNRQHAYYHPARDLDASEQYDAGSRLSNYQMRSRGTRREVVQQALSTRYMNRPSLPDPIIDQILAQSGVGLTQRELDAINGRGIFTPKHLM